MRSNRIAVVGSTDFPLQLGVGHILRKMQEQSGPEGTYPPVFLVRGDKLASPIAGVDAMVHVLARGALQLPCHPMPLDPAVKARDRGLERDKRLVDEADVVLAFFHPDRVMLGGTANVVGLAMTKGIEVHAWTLDATGTLIDVGSLGSSGGSVIPRSLIGSLAVASAKAGPYRYELSTGDTLSVTLTYDET
jgi:hypothetical protein